MMAIMKEIRLLYFILFPQKASNIKMIKEANKRLISGMIGNNDVEFKYKIKLN